MRACYAVVTTLRYICVRRAKRAVVAECFPVVDGKVQVDWLLRVFVRVDVQVLFPDFAEFPDGCAVVVAGEPPKSFHLPEDSPDGVALAFVEGEVADFELSGFAELYENMVPDVIAQGHGAVVGTKQHDINLLYLKFTILPFYSIPRIAVSDKT